MQAHWLDAPSSSIGADVLELEGIPYQKLSIDPEGYQPLIDELKCERGYVAQDEVALAPTTPGLSELCAQFREEHWHEEDEVRFVLEGAGVFDIRSRDDRFMRVAMTPGDLIIVPARRHHRFTLTEAKTVRCLRLFRDSSGWRAHYRTW